MRSCLRERGRNNGISRGEVRHASESNYGMNVDPFVEKKTVIESTSKERKLSVNPPETWHRFQPLDCEHHVHVRLLRTILTFLPTSAPTKIPFILMRDTPRSHLLEGVLHTESWSLR